MVLEAGLAVREGPCAACDAFLSAAPPRGAKSLFAGHAAGEGEPPPHARGVAATAVGDGGDAAAAVVRAVGQVPTVLGPPVPHAPHGGPTEAARPQLAQAPAPPPQLRPYIDVRQTAPQVTCPLTPPPLAAPPRRTRLREVHGRPNTDTARSNPLTKEQPQRPPRAYDSAQHRTHRRHRHRHPRVPTRFLGLVLANTVHCLHITLSPRCGCGGLRYIHHNPLVSKRPLCPTPGHFPRSACRFLPRSHCHSAHACGFLGRTLPRREKMVLLKQAKKRPCDAHLALPSLNCNALLRLLR